MTDDNRLPLLQSPSSPPARDNPSPKSTPLFLRETLPLFGASTRPQPRTINSTNTIPTYSHLSPIALTRVGSDSDGRLWRDRSRDTGTAGEEEREELTTKGRKRKRLAKACSACHKNKRRCDGFAPCSNCEFSSRPCLYLNAQGEPIPPPRTRDSSVTPTGRKDERYSGGDELDLPRRSSAEQREENQKPKLNTIELVESDPALSAELVDIFIRRVPPYSAILHIPTFHHRIYTSAISPLLLDAVYAFAARLCNNPIFVSTFPPDHPPYLRGEPFAKRAHQTVHRIMESRRSWTDEEARSDRGTWEETEFVQALCLLSTYGNCLRQVRQALYYLDVGLAILRPDQPTSPLPLPSAYLQSTLSPLEFATFKEIRDRTFWMLVLADLCASANGRPRRLMDHEMCGVPLPGKEEWWYRYGGAGDAHRPGLRENPAGGNSWSTGWKPIDAIGEFGHVLRILSIFCDIMSVANGGGAGAPTTKHIPATQHENALKAWAISLPPDLRFDEPNLCYHITKLHSTVPQTSLSGWMYAYMHAVAECGMFYLQAATDLSRSGAQSLMAQRQGQAVENLAVILNSLGERGREGPLMTFPILVVSQWQEHVRITTSPSPGQILLEERIAQWWSEIGREWGFERQPVQDRGFYQVIPPDSQPQIPQKVSSPSHSTPLDMASERSFERYAESLPTGLGLYQTASPNQREHTNRQLPPLRPRAASSALPYHDSVSAHHHHIPSLKMDKEHHRMSLPSISSELYAKERNGITELTTIDNKEGQYRNGYSEKNEVRHDQEEGRPDSPRWKEMTGIAALLSAAQRENDVAGPTKSQRQEPRTSVV